MLQAIRKIFDTTDRDLKAIMPIVERVNDLEDSIKPLSDDELRAKTDEFKERLDTESLEQILPEAFAVAREVSRRTLGMRQFDVQILGGIVLHQGNIAEMRTGEGKTLVAVAPMYLNALSGKGAHLVTVNDYLARRDAVWMGPVYHFLGQSVGVVQGQGQDNDELGGSYIYDPTYQHDDPRYTHLRPCSRREAYLTDITYGTNHEFGFDYLRDNMAFQKEQLSMRDLNFAIIDEVDSILVDEARTPHIISGPSQADVSIYKEVDKVVREMDKIQRSGETEEEREQFWTGDKKSHSVSLTEDAMDHFEREIGVENIADDPKLFHHLNASVKAYALFDKNDHYVLRGTDVVIIDENTGRPMFGRRFSDGLHQALEAKEGVPVQRESQTIAVITFQNLFRMYDKLSGMTGTAKTEEDEFRKIYGLEVVAIPTNKPNQRADEQDVVFKTMDAKMRGIAREILRVYAKQQPVLVGTRSIEMTEAVSHRLTNEMIQKLLLADIVIFSSEKDKSVAGKIKKELDAATEHPLEQIDIKTLKKICQMGDLPHDPLGEEAATWFAKHHELIEHGEAVQRIKDAAKHGIAHNVLNAKYHEKEALIISEAGRKGAITIATNMAGRGVDILLGGRVEDETVMKEREAEVEDGGLASDYADTFMSFRRGGVERAAPPLPLSDTERRQLAEEVKALGGLYILGTERHESRRIDNQLRGRAGRQGDPGESRFFVSLEDQLWKIFNAKMMENPILKTWPTQEEVRAKFISNMIHKTQERIENHFFEARKHVLEYDDVLNSQRETIYAMRREILLGMDMRQDILNAVEEVIGDAADKHWAINEDGEAAYDYEALFAELNSMFPLIDSATLEDLKDINPGPQLREFCVEKALEAYNAKAERVGEEVMPELERHVMLRAVNDQWMEHLQMIDYIREGIGLRGYGQIDPLVAYKRETFDLFQSTQRQIREQAVKMIFTAEVRVEDPPAPQMQRVDEDALPEAEAAASAAEATPEAAPAVGASEAAAVAPVEIVDNGEFDINSVDWKKIKRNDPCPCGSGNKFKNCHYKEVRQMNLA